MQTAMALEALADLPARDGREFHRDYGPVLRALLFAADRHRAREITGATGSAIPGREW